MPLREEVIAQLKKKSDLRADWKNRVVLDALQEFEEPCTIADLVEAINEKHPTDDKPLVDYNLLYPVIQTSPASLIKQGAVQNNSLTKKIKINPEYITAEVRFLPVSNYCVVILTLSVVAWVISLIADTMIPTTSAVLLIGVLYVVGQHLGSEFKW